MTEGEVRKAAQSPHRVGSRDITRGNVTTRSAVGTIRISTDTPAADGLSLAAQAGQKVRFRA